MKKTLISALGLGALIGLFFITSVNAADSGSTPPADSDHKAPIIQFETNFYDFGKLIAPGKVSGVFKFKNVGTGLLELAQPEMSCGCTDAKAVPENVAPGQNGEITYTINLDHAMGQVQKRITVHCNDDKTPEVDLTVQLDYTPLYELSPMALKLELPADKGRATGSFNVVRNGNGQPLELKRLVTSQKWVEATLDSSTPQANSRQINITVHRPPNPPAMMIANVQLWADNQPDRPVQTLFLSCDIQGELSATPSQIYWVIPDFGNSISNYPADSLTRTIKLKPIENKPVTVKNVTTSIKGMKVQLMPDEAGKLFNLILKFDQLPQEFTSGEVTVETSLASLPKLRVPVTVSVAPK